MSQQERKSGKNTSSRVRFNLAMHAVQRENLIARCDEMRDRPTGHMPRIPFSAGGQIAETGVARFQIENGREVELSVDEVTVASVHFEEGIPVKDHNSDRSKAQDELVKLVSAGHDDGRFPFRTLSIVQTVGDAPLSTGRLMGAELVSYLPEKYAPYESVCFDGACPDRILEGDTVRWTEFNQSLGRVTAFEAHVVACTPKSNTESHVFELEPFGGSRHLPTGTDSAGLTRRSGRELIAGDVMRKEWVNANARDMKLSAFLDRAQTTGKTANSAKQDPGITP